MDKKYWRYIILEDKLELTAVLPKNFVIKKAMKKDGTVLVKISPDRYKISEVE
jgi:hypothetical protein